MTKIYLLMEEWFGAKSVVACFSAIEKAEEYAKNTGRPRINFSIVEMEVK